MPGVSARSNSADRRSMKDCEAGMEGTWVADVECVSQRGCTIVAILWPSSRAHASGGLLEPRLLAAFGFEEPGHDGHANQIGQICGLHLFHDVRPPQLDRTQAKIQIERNLPIGVA